MSTIKETEEYLLNIKPEFKDIANSLIEIILSTCEKLSIAIKWKRLTFAYNVDFHDWICAIDITKNSVNLIFHFGGLLEDKKNLLKLVPVNSLEK
ncbi:MAG TPA: DUF1801 domain-containing protein [Clostridia bacterium]|nr:DUF1801 domain-containing protein [Clostridia bacterium]